jgi:hypothetical protein
LHHLNAEIEIVLGFVSMHGLEKALPGIAEMCPELLLSSPEKEWRPALEWLQGSLKLSKTDCAMALEKEPRLLSAIHYKQAMINVGIMHRCDVNFFVLSYIGINIGS